LPQRLQFFSALRDQFIFRLHLGDYGTLGWCILQVANPIQVGLPVGLYWFANGSALMT
jgi:hypothetical protein